MKINKFHVFLSFSFFSFVKTVIIVTAPIEWVCNLGLYCFAKSYLWDDRLNPLETENP